MLARIAITLVFAVAGTIYRIAPARAADSYPQKPVHLIVASSPGGNPDTYARLMAHFLGERFGQQFVVEDRPGAGGNVGADLVVKSVPDGYTILVGAGSIFSMNPHVYRAMSFDPFRDLAAVTLGVVASMWLVVHPSVPARSVSELVALAKSRAQPLAYASSGKGSIHHLTMEAFKRQAGVDFMHVPFKGAGQSVQALLAGEVPVAFVGYPAIESAVKAGRLRVLGFSMAKRSILTPDIPTVAESGVPGFDMAANVGVFVPAGTPRSVIQQLSQGFNAALREPHTLKRLTAIGLEPIGTTPEQAEKVLRADSERDGVLSKRLELSAD